VWFDFMVRRWRPSGRVVSHLVGLTITMKTFTRTSRRDWRAASSNTIHLRYSGRLSGRLAHQSLKKVKAARRRVGLWWKGCRKPGPRVAVFCPPFSQVQRLKWITASVGKRKHCLATDLTATSPTATCPTATGPKRTVRSHYVRYSVIIMRDTH
jgi:hypothetical protein